MSRNGRLIPVLLFIIAVNSHALSQDLSSLSRQDSFRINGSITAKLQYYNTDRESARSRGVTIRREYGN